MEQGVRSLLSVLKVFLWLFLFFMLVQDTIVERYRMFRGDIHIVYALSVASCLGFENLEVTLKAAQNHRNKSIQIYQF